MRGRFDTTSGAPFVDGVNMISENPEEAKKLCHHGTTLAQESGQSDPAYTVSEVETMILPDPAKSKPSPEGLKNWATIAADLLLKRWKEKKAAEAATSEKPKAG